ncbi:MAG: hypothetical protein ACR2KD_04300 [Thermoleophilaceae bacterium]
MVALLWIGNVLLLLVVVPVVVALFQRVMVPVREIERTAVGLRARGASLVSLLDAVDDLPTTQRLVGDTGTRIDRYGAALGKIL